MRLVLRIPILSATAVAVVGGLAACTLFAPSSATPAAEPAADPAEPDNWVIVTFAHTEEEADLDVMDRMLPTELAADEALQAADAGWIDGNEVGEHQYDLYFVGWDRDEMWTVLEPVLAAAPVPWTRVELRDGPDDARATVMTTDRDHRTPIR